MIGKWIAVLLLASPAGIAAAQQPPSAKPDQQQSQTRSQTQSKDQQDPLAAAARRAREQQKNQPRATKVWDNDSLPTTATSSAVSDEGAASTDEGAADSGAGGEQGADNSAKPSSVKDQKADLQRQLDDAKAHLKSVQTDLDIATRTYQLDQQTLYSNPNHDSDTEGATKLKNEQSDADAKKQEVADAQKQVDDLKAKLQEAESEAAKSSKNPQ